jgi:hypothetical protein
MRAFASGVSSSSRTVRRTLASTAALSSSAGGACGSRPSSAGNDLFQEYLDSAGLPRTVEARCDRRLDCAAALVAQHDEERGAQVQRGVLQGTQDRGTQHVAGDADDEQFAEAGIEYQFRRHPAVAAAEDGGVGLLAPGQFRQNFLLHGRKARLAATKRRLPACRRASASSAVCGGA